jgi:hypothetical protein
MHNWRRPALQPKIVRTKVNLITYVQVESADNHDSKALLPAIQNTEEKGMKPEVLNADTSYGSDTNVQEAKKAGVEVISPAGGRDPEVGKIRISEFSKDESNIVDCCPNGQVPWDKTESKSGVMTFAFDKKVCENCADKDRCPVVISGDIAELKCTSKEMRLF